MKECVHKQTDTQNPYPDAPANSPGNHEFSERQTVKRESSPKQTPVDSHVNIDTSVDSHVNTKTPLDSHVYTETPVDSHVNTKTLVDKCAPQALWISARLKTLWTSARLKPCGQVRNSSPCGQVRNSDLSYPLLCNYDPALKQLVPLDSFPYLPNIEVTSMCFTAEDLRIRAKYQTLSSRINIFIQCNMPGILGALGSMANYNLNTTEAGF